MLQADAILREVFRRPDIARKAVSYLDKLPSKWKGYIKNYIKENIREAKIS